VTAAQLPEGGGPYLEDFDVGDTFRSRIGRTVTEADNVWFTCLTMNTNQVHFNTPYARAARYERPLVNSCFTLALITGLTVPDTSERAVANLGWSDVSLPRPVFVGDTLWAETEVLEVRTSASNPSAGIVSVRSRGINDRAEVVIEFRRTFMVPRRDAATAERLFVPTTDEAWHV
jgi:itaconyl-CoA hydratase